MSIKCVENDLLDPEKKSSKLIKLEDRSHRRISHGVFHIHGIFHGVLPDKFKIVLVTPIFTGSSEWDIGN